MIQTGHNSSASHRIRRKSELVGVDAFAQNVRPTEQGVREALEIVRKLREPFAQNALAQRLDLLMLPFLRGIPTTKQRVARLQTALEFAADEFTAEDRIVYRHVFQESVYKDVGKRHMAAAAEINEHRPPDLQVQSGSLRRKEERLLKQLPVLLFAPSFEERLDEQYPLERDTASAEPVYPEDTYERLFYSWDIDIDEDDPRKHTDHRLIKLRTVLPHQRIFGLRHFSNRVPATPIENGVSLDDPDQKYLGTFSDSIEGTPIGWFMHFFHVGLKLPGEEWEIKTHEEYLDEGDGERHPHILIVARFATHEAIRLGLRVPKRFRDRAKIEARVLRHPLHSPNTLKRWELEIDQDGWARYEFPDCIQGLGYGIYLRNVDIYKN
jgi:hypothetical protein